MAESVVLLKEKIRVPGEWIMWQGMMEHSMLIVQDKFEIRNKIYIIFSYTKGLKDKQKIYISGIQCISDMMIEIYINR